MPLFQFAFTQAKNLKYLKSRGRDVRLRPYVRSGLTRLVRAGYSCHDSGASRERAQIMRRAQDGSIHMQRSLPSSSYPARSTLISRIYPTLCRLEGTFLRKLT